MEKHQRRRKSQATNLKVVSNQKRELKDIHLRHLLDERKLSETVVQEAGLFSVDENLSNELIGVGAKGFAIPYHNLQGNVVAYQIRLDDDEKSRYLQSKSASIPFYYGKSNPQIFNISKPLWLVEGVLKKLTLESVKQLDVPIIAYNSCAYFRHRGAEGFPEEFEDLIKGNRTIVLIPDTSFFANRQEADSVIALARLLLDAGCKVSFIDVRIEGVEKKVGPDDFVRDLGWSSLESRTNSPMARFSHEEPDYTLDSKTSVKKFFSERVLADVVQRGIFTQAAKVTKVSMQELRGIYTAEIQAWYDQLPRYLTPPKQVSWDPSSEPPHVAIEQLARIIMESEDWYTEPGSGNLCLLTHNEKTNFVRSRSGRDFAHYVANRAPFAEGYWSDEGEFIVNKYEKSFPSDLLDNFICDLKMFCPLIRPLKFVCQTPFVLEGQLVNTPGYHPDLQVYFSGETIKPIFGQSHLMKLLNSFPFQDEVSKQNALAAIIGAVLFREEFAGDRFMVLCKGDHDSLGKSRFARVLSWIAQDREPGPANFSGQNDEMDKRLCSAAKTSDIIIIDDVVKSNISSGVLNSVITSEVIELRDIGQCVNFRRRNNMQIVMTQNDGTLSADLTARSLFIYFSKEALMESPFEEGFEPIDYAKEHRSEIVSEIVGMYYRWKEMGGQKIYRKTSKFKEFVATMNGIMKANEYHQFMANFETSMVKLDRIPDAILHFVAKEYDTSGKTRFENSAGGWAEQIKDQSESPVFEGASSPTSRSNRTQWGLQKLLDLKVIPYRSTYGVCILVKATRDPLSGKQKGSGNNSYILEVIEGGREFDWGAIEAKANSIRKSLEAAPTGTIKKEVPGGNVKGSYGDTGDVGTSAPFYNIEGGKNKKNKNFLRGFINGENPLKVPTYGESHDTPPNHPPEIAGFIFFAQEPVFCLNETQMEILGDDWIKLKMVFSDPRRIVITDDSAELYRRSLPFGYTPSSVFDLNVAHHIAKNNRKFIMQTVYELRRIWKCDTNLQLYLKLKSTLKEKNQWRLYKLEQKCTLATVVQEENIKLVDFSMLTPELVGNSYNELEKLQSPKFKTQFIQFGSKTGKYETRNPCIHNLPNNESVRRAIRPPRGKVFVVGDYRQLDLRILAELSGDKELIRQFKDNVDPYAVIGKLITNANPRRVGKGVVLAIINGGQHEAIYRRCRELELNVSRDEAVDLLFGFRELYPKAWSWIEIVGYSTEVSSKFGRFLDFPPHASRSQRVNNTLQVSSADICKLALIKAVEKSQQFDAEVMFSLKDEIVLSARSNDANQVKEWLVSTMMCAGEAFFTKVPCEVKVYHSDCWYPPLKG